ncbi:MAG TPA: hypothetical protein VF101_16845 [Gaiellaceae bacterium]
MQGFFTPSFFALMWLKLGLDAHLLPKSVEKNSSTAVLVLAGAAILLGLLLLGVYGRIIWLLSGEPLRWAGLGKREQRRFEDATTRSASADEAVKVAGLLELDQRFPSKASRLKPTRFGNAAAATISYAESRWHLDSNVVWPRIEAMLTEQENSLHGEATSNLAFLVNSTVGSGVVGTLLALDGVIYRFHDPEWSWIHLLPTYFVLPLAAAYLLYGVSVEALLRWNERIRASIDLHRLELYDRLGVRRPASPADEERLALVVNQLLVYGEPKLPTSARARTRP